MIQYITIETFNKLANRFVKTVSDIYLAIFYPHSIKFINITLDEIEDISNWLTKQFGPSWDSVIVTFTPKYGAGLYPVTVNFKNKAISTQFKLVFSDLISRISNDQH